MAKKAKAAKPAKKTTKKGNVSNFERGKRKRAPKVPKIPRQPSLPTMEVPHNKAVEKAGVEAHEAKIERMRLTEVETKRNDKLIAVMKQEGLKVYENRIGSDVLRVELTVKDPELKVKTSLKPFDAEAETKRTRKVRRPSDENTEAAVDEALEDSQLEGDQDFEPDDNPLDVDDDGGGFTE